MVARLAASKMGTTRHLYIRSRGKHFVRRIASALENRHAISTLGEESRDKASDYPPSNHDMIEFRRHQNNSLKLRMTGSEIEETIKSSPASAAIKLLTNAINPPSSLVSQYRR